MKLNIKSINIKNINMKNKKNIYILAACIGTIIVMLMTVAVVKKMNDNLEKVVSIDDMIGKTAKRKYVKVKDHNGDVFYLPKGFKISENVSEQTVKDGLVIIDDTGDKETNESEFVWIPVDNTDLGSFEEKFTNNIGSSYKTLDSNLLKENTEAEEYIQMNNSVYKYGGFYIARYEAGISDKLQNKLLEEGYFDQRYITQDTTKYFATKKYKPVSKSEAITWNYISWGGTFEETSSDGIAGNNNSNGAVKVAKSMYTNNFKTYVTSGLCYGSQWEAIMNFIDQNYYTNSCDEQSAIIDSSEVGNYYGVLQSTGSNMLFFIKNISDLAGNVWEWTMEGFNDMYRITRGGSYSSSGDMYSISSSKEFYPNDYSKEIGFRVALWIK